MHRRTVVGECRFGRRLARRRRLQPRTVEARRARARHGAATADQSNEARADSGETTCSCAHACAGAGYHTASSCGGDATTNPCADDNRNRARNNTAAGSLRANACAHDNCRRASDNTTAASHASRDVDSCNTRAEPFDRNNTAGHVDRRGTGRDTGNDRFARAPLLRHID